MQEVRLRRKLRVADTLERYVIIGIGKTALDTCVWLLTFDNGSVPTTPARCTCTALLSA